MITIKESVLRLQEKNEKVYLKYYFTNGMFEDMINNLPNDLLLRYDENLYRIKTISDLSDYVYNAVKYVTNIGDFEFPLEFHFSLINKWVAEKEKVFSMEYNKEIREHLNYRPYFLEFSGYCTNREYLNQLLKLITSDDKNYYSAYFYTEKIKETKGLSYPEWINDEKIIAILSGEVLVSASPIEKVKGQLFIVDDHTEASPEYKDILDDSIYRCEGETLKKHQQSYINDTLDNTILNGKPKILNVYNVGQGNCAAIEMEAGGNIFADIGLTNDVIELSSKNIEKSKQKISDVSPEVVILSHWDLDHILGVTNAADCIYDSTWVVPDLWGLMKYTSKKRNGQINYTYISDSAKRLLKYLDWRNKKRLLVVDDTFANSLIYSNPTENVSIWSGTRKCKSGLNERKQKYCITPTNNFGLIIHLKRNYSALLPGDCDYGVLPNDLVVKEINYLIVPHHCSKMSKPNIKCSEDKAVAVLSYGLHNKHNHPDMLHMKQLFDEGFEIVPTISRAVIKLDL